MDKAPTLPIVDDEPAMRASLAEALQEAGFNVMVSGTGEHAVVELKAAHIAGIVTDIRLGVGLNGWEVARHARQQHPHMAVIYMTGDSAFDWKVEGVPPSVMVQKPFVIAQMVTAVSNLLNAVAVSPIQPSLEMPAGGAPIP